MADEEPEDPQDASKRAEKKTGAPPGRFSRFAKLTGLTAGVAARTLGHKVVNAFSSDEEATAERARRSREKSAAEMRKTLGELKGAAMKVGQMLATDPELLPPEMVEELSQLQHSAPPMDIGVVREVIESALEKRLEDLFDDFSNEPIGAASIGQVHKARTRDGLDVAVKVQYPGISDTIRSDMKNLGSLLVLARAGLPKERVDAYLDEVTTVIERESDYVNEANNLERFQVVLKNVPGVRVPIPVHEMTKKNVLVMELFKGTRLEDWLARAPQEQKTEQGRRLLRAYLEMIHGHGALHADPHPGNFLVLDQSPESDVDGVPAIGMLDLGCVRDYPTEYMDGMLELLAALWRHDLDDLQATWRRLGFIDKGVDPDLVYEWLSLVFSPLLTNQVTDFGTWKVQEDVLKFVLENPRIKLFAPPREAIFYLRVLAGLRALMHKVGMRLNVYELSRDVVKQRGLLDRPPRR
jgi:predicted unusual protein kinase regulating ubiquinone biosynthesis (AarF/ABC1/UbiB family)